VRVDVVALGLAGLAEVKIGTVGAAVSNTPYGHYPTRIACAPSVDVCIAACVVFRDSEQETNDVLTSSLLRRACRIIPPIVFNGILILRNSLSIGKWSYGIDILVGVRFGAGR
jgi:hypothetical protein